MSKKGRVGGTIGFILALALVGGTVVYSTMFDPNAAAKSSKPLGSSTGNVVSAYAEKKGLEETQKLATETLASSDWFATVAEGATYQSYSLSFAYSSDLTITQSNKTTMTATDLEGTVYSDKNYTYLKMNFSSAEGKTLTTSYAELFYAKSTGKYWSRILPYAQNPNDTTMIGDAEWENLFADSLLSMVDALDSGAETFERLIANKDVWKFNYLTGQFTYEEKAGDAKAASSFTVGYSPRLAVSTSSSLTSGEDKAEHISSFVAHYSNLNNTVVNVPESLKSKMGA